MADEDDSFYRRKLVIVRASDWFITTDKSAQAERRFVWYIGTVDPLNGDINVFRPILTRELDWERKMVAEHNQRIDRAGVAYVELSPANAPAKPADKTSEQGRKEAMARRAGPSPLFNPGTP